MINYWYARIRIKRESTSLLRNRPSVGRWWKQGEGGIGDLENRKASGAPSRQVTKFDAASVRGESEKYYNENEIEACVIPSYSKTDRVRQMIRKLRNIVPFPGNIGMFRKYPLCIMRKKEGFWKGNGCTGRDTYFEAGIIMNQPRVRGWKFKERGIFVHTGRTFIRPIL